MAKNKFQNNSFEGETKERVILVKLMTDKNEGAALASLEELGYVERRPSEEDRRVTLVYPTEKALAVLPTVRSVIREWNEYLTEGMDEAELERFAETLSRLAERARAYYEEKEKI